MEGAGLSGDGREVTAVKFAGVRPARQRKMAVRSKWPAKSWVASQRGWVVTVGCF